MLALILRFCLGTPNGGTPGNNQVRVVSQRQGIPQGMTPSSQPSRTRQVVMGQPQGRQVIAGTVRGAPPQGMPIIIIIFFRFFLEYLIKLNITSDC